MSQNDFSLDESLNDDHLSIKDKRGSFLFNISILSWFSQGSSLLGAIVILAKGKSSFSEQLKPLDDLNVENMSIDNPFVKTLMLDSLAMVNTFMDNFYQIYFANILIVVIGALAVYLMFSLRKIGFLLYIIYCASELFVLYNYFGNSLPIKISMMTTGFISCIFIILYAVNLKRMTK